MTRTEGHTSAEELTTEEAKRCVLDEVRKICPQGLVAFSGGEFLLRDDALELLDYARGLGLYSFVNTSGRRLDRARFSEIRRATRNRVIFGFSLDSIDGRAQEQTKGCTADHVLGLARMCDEARIGYFFLVTITKHNLATLPKTMEFLREHNIPTLRSPFVPRGAGRAVAQEMAFTRDDMREVIHPALRGNPLSYISYCPFFASPEYMEKLWRELRIPIATLGCQAARGFVGISAEGELAPCVHLLDSSVTCGNVRQTPLSVLLETDPTMVALRDGSRVKGKCGRCRYKHSCRGCRALAYYATGDCLEADPACFFEPVDESTRSEFEEAQTRNVAAFVRFIATRAPWNVIFRPASFRARLNALLWTLTTAEGRPKAQP